MTIFYWSKENSPSPLKVPKSLIDLIVYNKGFV